GQPDNVIRNRLLEEYLDRLVYPLSFHVRNADPPTFDQARFKAQSLEAMMTAGLTAATVTVPVMAATTTAPHLTTVNPLVAATNLWHPASAAPTPQNSPVSVPNNANSESFRNDVPNNGPNGQSGWRPNRNGYGNNEGQYRPYRQENQQRMQQGGYNNPRAHFGDNTMHTPLAHYTACNYQDGQCTLVDGSALVWRPSEEQLCEYVRKVTVPKEMPRRRREADAASNSGTPTTEVPVAIGGLARQREANFSEEFASVHIDAAMDALQNKMIMDEITAWAAPANTTTVTYSFPTFSLGSFKSYLLRMADPWSCWVTLVVLIMTIQIGLRLYFCFGNLQNPALFREGSRPVNLSQSASQVQDVPPSYQPQHPLLPSRLPSLAINAPQPPTIHFQSNTLQSPLTVEYTNVTRRKARELNSRMAQLNLGTSASTSGLGDGSEEEGPRRLHDIPEDDHEACLPKRPRREDDEDDDPFYDSTPAHVMMASLNTP
ncbi:hypothetical protein AAVH_13865, partial [Aphelenchoides avenae]